jgi:hypothetical protein
LPRCWLKEVYPAVGKGMHRIRCFPGVGEQDVTWNNKNGAEQGDKALALLKAKKKKKEVKTDGAQYIRCHLSYSCSISNQTKQKSQALSPRYWLRSPPTGLVGDKSRIPPGASGNPRSGRKKGTV